MGIGYLQQVQNISKAVFQTTNDIKRVVGGGEESWGVKAQENMNTKG